MHIIHLAPSSNFGSAKKIDKMEKNVNHFLLHCNISDYSDI